MLNYVSGILIAWDTFNILTLKNFTCPLIVSFVLKTRLLSDIVLVLCKVFFGAFRIFLSHLKLLLSFYRHAEMIDHGLSRLFSSTSCVPFRLAKEIDEVRHCFWDFDAVDRGRGVDDTLVSFALFLDCVSQAFANLSEVLGELGVQGVLGLGLGDGHGAGLLDEGDGGEGGGEEEGGAHLG